MVIGAKMKKYKDKEDFINKQLKDSMAKIQGAINLLDNSASHFARNKMVGLYQKLGYILLQINNWNESKENENDQNSGVHE